MRQGEGCESLVMYWGLGGGTRYVVTAPPLARSRLPNKIPFCQSVGYALEAAPVGMEGASSLTLRKEQRQDSREAAPAASVPSLSSRELVVLAMGVGMLIETENVLSDTVSDCAMSSSHRTYQASGERYPVPNIREKKSIGTYETCENSSDDCTYQVHSLVPGRQQVLLTPDPVVSSSRVSSHT